MYVCPSVAACGLYDELFMLNYKNKSRKEIKTIKRNSIYFPYPSDVNC
jgi:hypothetical protein